MALSTKQLSALVDKHYLKHQQRLAEQKKVDALEKQEKEMRDSIMGELKAQKTQTVGGKVGRAELKFKKFPVVTDSAAFEKFAKKKGNEDLIKHTPNPTAIKDRWENDVQVPGVKAEEVVTLSITKA